MELEVQQLMFYSIGKNPSTAQARTLLENAVLKRESSVRRPSRFHVESWTVTPPFRDTLRVDPMFEFLIVPALTLRSISKNPSTLSKEFRSCTADRFCGRGEKEYFNAELWRSSPTAHHRPNNDYFLFWYQIRGQDKCLVAQKKLF
eukprot:scaffold7168_cov182-Amphora_coffeaeformis.AAC.8